MKKLSVLLIMLTLLASCKNEKQTDSVTPEAQASEQITKEVKKLKIALEAESDSQLSGNVIFIQEGDSVTMNATVAGLTEGSHAIHIHDKGDCSDPKGLSAGGHWNPTGAPHGQWGSQEGYHKGDIGNFNVDASGNGSISITTNQWCIGCGDLSKDIINKAIIIHEGVDDFTSQPSGAAGYRVGCGVISK